MRLAEEVSNRRFFLSHSLVYLFQIDALGDHLGTCTAHSGAKKAHDWVVDPLADLFRTTHRVKTQQVVKSRGQHCGDIELAGY